MAISNYDIKKVFDDFYHEGYSAWSAYYEEAATDLRYYLGDQWSAEDKERLRKAGRDPAVFNYIRRNINALTGYQRKNRLSSVVNPVENSDQLCADLRSQLLIYAFQAGDAYQVFSDCFGGAIKTGWNLCSIYKDFRDDPLDGDIKYSRYPYSGYLTDPYLTKLDLSDCSYIILRKYLSADQSRSILPGHEKDIRTLESIGWTKDDKFSWLPYKRQSDAQPMMAFDEFYQQKWRDVSLLVDMETGEHTEWDGDRERLKILKDLYPNIEIVKKPKRYIERHIFLNGEHIDTDVNPFGLDEYPFVPFIGLFEPESDDWSLKIQSLVRCQRDPQRGSNRRRLQMTDMVESQINSGWIAESGSIVDSNTLFGVAQGKVIWKQKGAPDPIKIPPAVIPESIFGLQQLYDNDMTAILGLNDAAFGIPESGTESGLMMMLRQSSAIVNLQDVFDNFRYSQKLISKKTLKLMQTWSPQKIERILNQKPPEQFYANDSEKYDITISEGVLTDSQKMIYFRQLLDLYQMTNANGQSPITAQMLVDAAPIQGKSTLNRQIEENEQQIAQANEQQQQIQQQLLDSQRQASQAQAISDIALSKERFTRAVANMGLQEERNSEAVENRAQAALERAKAINELQAMGDDRLIKLLEIIRMMEGLSKKDELEAKSEDVTLSASAERLNAAFPNPTGMQGAANGQPQGGNGPTTAI